VFRAATTVASSIRFASGAYRTTATLVIRHANIIDGTGAALRPRSKVVVSDGCIDAIVPDDDAALAACAGEVDGRGRFLIPGLWDCHVHAFCSPDWVETMMPAFVAHGIVGIRDMHGNIELARRTRDEIARGARVGPRIVTPGLLIDGHPPFLPNTQVARTPEEGREAVRLRKEQGADFVKVYSRLARDVYVAIVEEAETLGLPVAGHVPFSVSAMDASNLGQRAFEHLMGLEMGVSTEEDRHRQQQMREAPRVPLDAANLRATFSRRKAEALIETLARNGTWQTPTAVAWRALAAHPLCGAADALAADPRSSLLPWTIRQTWTSMPAERIKPASTTAQGLVPLYQHLVGELHRAGVPILAGSDAPNPFVFPGSSLHEELALLVDAGLTPMDAILAATANPARFLGLFATHGTIEPGKAADMVLIEGNPLEDIGAVRTIAGVVLNGKFLDRNALDGLLKQAEAAAARTPPFWRSGRSEVIVRA
jgi:imidazolonepropionase-like amidohydrolase